MTRARGHRRGRRGWVLIAVLAVLALLSALAAAFFVQAQNAGAGNRIGMARLAAANRADLQLQTAIRGLRARDLDLGIVAGDCTDAQVTDGTCPSMFISALGDNGTALDLAAGGGLQGQFFIYRRAVVDDGRPANRYVVRAVGYSGYTLDSPNLVTSMVEAEVDVGSGTGFKCVGGYECQ